MRELRKYNLYNVKDELVFTGTAPECVEFCGGTTSGFHNAIKYNRNCFYCGYRIEVAEEVGDKAATDSCLVATAKRWDEFCKPIREKYGIPVYRPGKEVRR